MLVQILQHAVSPLVPLVCGSLTFLPSLGGDEITPLAPFSVGFMRRPHAEDTSNPKRKEEAKGRKNDKRLKNQKSETKESHLKREQ
jgi:hypothetical protein